MSRNSKTAPSADDTTQAAPSADDTTQAAPAAAALTPEMEQALKALAQEHLADALAAIDAKGAQELAFQSPQ